LREFIYSREKLGFLAKHNKEERQRHPQVAAAAPLVNYRDGWAILGHVLT